MLLLELRTPPDIEDKPPQKTYTNDILAPREVACQRFCDSQERHLRFSPYLTRDLEQQDTPKRSSPQKGSAIAPQRDRIPVPSWTSVPLRQNLVAESFAAGSGPVVSGSFSGLSADRWLPFRASSRSGLGPSRSQHA